MSIERDLWSEAQLAEVVAFVGKLEAGGLIAVPPGLGRLTAQLAPLIAEAERTQKSVPLFSSAQTAPALPKLAYSLDEILEMVPFGRTSLYEDIRDGKLIANKRGRTTFVLPENLAAYMRSFPTSQEA